MVSGPSGSLPTDPFLAVELLSFPPHTSKPLCNSTFIGFAQITRRPWLASVLYHTVNGKAGDVTDLIWAQVREG